MSRQNASAQEQRAVGASWAGAFGALAITAIATPAIAPEHRPVALGGAYVIGGLVGGITGAATYQKPSPRKRRRKQTA